MASADRPAIWWVRRDFRLRDHPALRAAVDAGGPILPLFVLDPVLLRSPGKGRGPWLRASLAALDADLRSGGGRGLTVVHGEPAIEVLRIAREVGAEQVHISADFAPTVCAETRPSSGVSLIKGWSSNAPDRRTQWRRAPCTTRRVSRSRSSRRSTGPGSHTELAARPRLWTRMR